MTQRLADATTADYERLLAEIGGVGGCSSAQEAAQRFVETVYGRFADSLVLLRLFITIPYDALPEEDRQFVDNRGVATGTSHLINAATPIFTLLGTRGKRGEWNERRSSEHFRCIPLASTAFVASLSMLSRQFDSVGLDLELIDDWQAKVAATGRADRFRGLLYIAEAGSERDQQGRMIVPKQDFVAASNVRTTFGCGSGYSGHPTLATLFAFTDETIERAAVEPFMNLLDAFIGATEPLVANGRYFQGNPQISPR